MLRRLFGVCVVSCFLGATGLVLSQETFAPLITDNCVGFVHVDLRKVELDKIKAAAIKWSTQGLQEIHFDEKSLKAITREYNKLFDKIDELIRPTFKLVADELGIRELAVIIDGWDSDNGQPIGFLAIPWKNKTDEDLKTLSDLIEPSGIHLGDFWVEGDFLLFMGILLDDNKNYVKNLVPSKNSKIYEALKEAGDGEIKIAFAGNDKILKEIKETDRPLMEPQVKNMILFAANKVEWISVTVSLGQYIGDSRKFSCKTVIKVPRKTDAVFLRNLIDGCIENGIFFAKTAMTLYVEQDPEMQPFQIFIPLVAELGGGLLRNFLPEVMEDRLVISFETDKFMSNYEASCLSTIFGVLAGAIQSILEK